mmetsp:Transcript_55688/g.113833  ORF Transcript_55688/g.113833 Transcript_55688/m.113833 type:complete len:943 (+) Transcript_55688:119-2947(+)
MRRYIIRKIMITNILKWLPRVLVAVILLDTFYLTVFWTEMDDDQGKASSLLEWQKGLLVQVGSWATQNTDSQHTLNTRAEGGLNGDQGSNTIRKGEQPETTPRGNQQRKPWTTPAGDLSLKSPPGNKLKWYVYQMPPRFLKPAHPDVSGEYSKLAAEQLFYDEIVSKNVSAQDAGTADVYYVPVFVNAFLLGEGKTLERQADAQILQETRELTLDAIGWVKSRWLYWKRTNGADHVFVFSHDNGPCLDISYKRAFEDPVSRSLLRELQNSLVLTHTGDLKSGCFDPNHFVQIPPSVSRAEPVSKALQKTLNGKMIESDRQYFMYYNDVSSLHSATDPWQGIRLLYGPNGTRQNHGQIPSLEPCIEDKNTKNAAYCEARKDACKEAEMQRDRVFSRGVRQFLAGFIPSYQNKCSDCKNVKMLYQNGLSKVGQRIDEMIDSTFCLSIRGFADWNVRTFEAMATSCIPVIISDDANLPYQDVIDWGKISVRLREPYAQNLYHVLSGISAKQIVKMRTHIRDTVLSFTYSALHREGKAVEHAEAALLSLLTRRKESLPKSILAEAIGFTTPIAYPKTVRLGNGEPVPVTKSDDICFAIQMSPNRMEMLMMVAKQWAGPIFAVVHVSAEDLRKGVDPGRFQDNFFSLLHQTHPNRKSIHLEFYSTPEEWSWYPVNNLRNLALTGCAKLSTWAMTVDVDFVPSSGAHAAMLAHAKELLSSPPPEDGRDSGRRALVVPAFEALDEVVTDRRRLQGLLGDKTKLADLYMSEPNWRWRVSKHTSAQLWPFDLKRSPTGHRASQSETFFKSDKRYSVKYRWGWEPYLLLRAPFPEYDESFVQYGMNKVEYTYELAAARFEFIVIPDAWLIHAHVDPEKKKGTSKPKPFQVGWSCWAPFAERVYDTYGGYRGATPCWAAKYVYPDVENLYADKCITNPSNGKLKRLSRRRKGT